MRIFKQNKLLTLMLAILFSFSFCVSMPIENLTNATEPQPAYPDTIDITYYGANCGENSNKCITKDGVESPYNGEPIYITEDKTIELNGVTIEGTNTDPSPITIEPGVTVNIILSGENTLTAKSDKLSAGIYVKQNATDPNNVINATLNIFGKNNENEGNKLTVTGGKFGAAIGGVGTNGHTPPYNQGTPGVINICSGTILAQGGSDSAGIGAGARASANEINIYGGDITALAGSSGAGIGAGYATSGTSTLGVQVGDFTGGIINITGGTIRAAAGKFKLKDDGITYYSFDDFNIYNTEYFFENCYESNGFGGGIGGGYGAASGTITIGGNADVTAIGSCGGTGIGTGRGTSSTNKYSTGCTPVNITIEGNAKVVAATPNENRDKEKPGSGAAIGGGRGFNDGGTIKILENANVTAVSTNYKNIQDIAYQDNAGSSCAAAIGGSWTVFNLKTTEPDPTLIAKPDTLQIDPTTTISAVSDGFVPAINAPTGENVSTLLALNFNEEEFFNYHNSDILDNQNIYPLKVTAKDRSENSNNETAFAINKANASCYINLPNATTYKLKVNGQIPTEEIYLSNGVEDNSAEFQAGHYGETEYKCNGFTSPIEQETTITHGNENLNIKIKGQEGNFETGAIFHAIGVTDPDQINELTENLDDVYENKLERVHFYDIGVTYRNGINENENPAEYKTFRGGPVTISVQVPNGWDKNELLALYVKAGEGDDETYNHRIETIDGVDYLSYETTHFSKFATFDPLKLINHGLNTGDNIHTLILAILSMFFKSFSSMFMLYCQR